MIASDIGTVQLKDAFGYGRKQGGGDTRSMWSRRTAGTRCRSFRRDCFRVPGIHHLAMKSGYGVGPQMERDVTSVVACCPKCKAEASPGFEIDVRMIARFREGVHLSASLASSTGKCSRALKRGKRRPPKGAGRPSSALPRSAAPRSLSGLSADHRRDRNLQSLVPFAWCIPKRGNNGETNKSRQNPGPETSCWRAAI